jgi:hypothetical protein
MNSITMTLAALLLAASAHGRSMSDSYTPTKLQWLTMHLNSTMATTYDSGETFYSIHYVDVPPSTVMMRVIYSIKSDRAHVNKMIEMQKGYIPKLSMAMFGIKPILSEEVSTIEDKSQITSMLSELIPGRSPASGDIAQRGCCSHHGGDSGLCVGGKVVCKDGKKSSRCRCQ